MGKKNKQAKQGGKNSVPKKMPGITKSKTKTVNTNLKKLNFHNKTKTASADKAFTEIQDVLVAGKQTTKQAEQKPVQKVSVEHHPPPDVDAALDSMENLAMVTS